MPKYYCDYCDVFLTHDSPSVRKTHNGGRRHKENVRMYYQAWMEEQAQKLIDATTRAFTSQRMLTPAAAGPPVAFVPPGMPTMMPPRAFVNPMAAAAGMMRAPVMPPAAFFTPPVMPGLPPLQQQPQPATNNTSNSTNGGGAATGGGMPQLRTTIKQQPQD